MQVTGNASPRRKFAHMIMLKPGKAVEAERTSILPVPTAA
jgi:hypothetical protein